jgi:hypothetical protein
VLRYYLYYNYYYYLCSKEEFFEYKNIHPWCIKYFNENNDLHREDGPAYFDSWGFKHWFKNGKLHNEVSHALEYPNGNKIYYYNGIRIHVESDKNLLKEIFKIKLKVFL